jgi:DNA-binding NtrC family response regulator
MGLILVADDDRMCRDSIQKTLEREGHTVEGAADVDSAMAAVGKQAFDLIVCDYRMPGKTGLDLLAELNEKGSQVPVLMISAYADANTEEAARQLGALELLRKPFRRQQLIRRASQALENCPMRRKL